MAYENNNEHKETVAKMVDGMRFCMMTYVAQSGNLHACPMTVQKREEDGTLWFLGSKSSDSVEALRHDDRVNLSFADGSQDFVSFNGRALLMENQEKISELWKEAYNAFYKGGREDPDIQLICFRLVGAQYWKGDGRLVTMFRLTKAAVTGDYEGLMGESRAVSYIFPNQLPHMG